MPSTPAVQPGRAGAAGVENLGPVPEEVLRLGRRRFNAGQRLEMTALAAELGVNRVTLYRWVGSRERLLVEVMWSLADRAFLLTLSQAPATAPDRAVRVVVGFLDLVLAHPGLRRLLANDIELAMRLLTHRAAGFQPRLNGAHGDLLQRDAPALALAMTLRQAGHDIALDRAALQKAFPDASAGLVVFLHGLSETEGAWCFRARTHHGRRETTYGTLLQRDVGTTPVFLRYNTGLHISDNGRSLSALLAELVRNWPVPPQDLVLVGHSMGGLVARSALHQAGSGTPRAEPWTELVRDTVTLGTPHLGAPLERSVHRLTYTLARLPETRPLAKVLGARSAGIKDLRRGTLVEDDWSGRDLDGAGPGRHTHVPLYDGARHFVVLATLARDTGSRTADLLGDLLVPPRSACGNSGDDDRLAFPPDHVHRLGGLHHFDLLNHPAVYQQLRRWLVQRPEGPRPAAPA